MGGASTNNNGNGGSGSGGGGYHGGSANQTRITTNPCMEMGNGGSNFVTSSASAVSNLAGSEAASVPNYSSFPPPNTASPQYIAGVGVGQGGVNVGGPGGNGLVVIQYML